RGCTMRRVGVSSSDRRGNRAAARVLRRSTVGGTQSFRMSRSVPSSDAAPRNEGTRQENAPERPTRPRRGSLLSKISQQSFLKESFKQLRSKRASFGVDGVSVDAYGAALAANTYVLTRKLRAGAFRFSPLRPVALPKGAGKH